MGRTQVSTEEIKDGSIKRADLNVTTSTQSVIARAVGSANIAISSTGADTGTGDVTFNLTTTGVTAGSATKVTFDIYGRISGASSLAAGDIPSGSTYYIQNQTTAAQSSSDFWISGTARASEFRSYNVAGTFYTALKTHASVAANYTYSLPLTYGANTNVLASDGTGNLYWATAATVTSVGLSMPGIFSVANSPVTTSGTLTVTLATQNANVVFAGPTSGGAAAPTFRSLVVADVPDLSGTYVTVAGATTVTGQKTFSNGVIVSANDLQVPKPTNVLIMMHFDGKSGSRQVVDIAGNKWTNVTPSVANASPASLSAATYKWGISSLSLNGSSNFLELSGTQYSKFGIGTGDFTTEFQVNFNSVAVTQVFQTIGSSSNGLVIRFVNGSGIRVDVAGSNWTFTWSPTTGTWYHVAVVRSSSSLSVYVNGSQIGTSQTASGSISTPTYPPTLFAFGRAGNTTVPVNHVSAFVDEFVMYNTAKWTTAFSAPTAANAYNTLVLTPPTNNSLDAGQSIVSDGSGNVTAAPPRAITTVTFALTEFVSNTTKYFYVSRGPGATQEDAKRSGNSGGMANANSCAPFLVPINGKITKAILNIQGTGVNQGTAAAVCYYQAQLYRVGYSAEHDPNVNSGNPVQIDFMFSSSSNPVGGYTVAATNLTIERTDLDTTVYAGDMLALKFLNGSTTSIIGLSQMAFVTLVIEET